MKIWIDKFKSAPEGYEWCKCFNDARSKIERAEADFAYSFRSHQPNEELLIDRIDIEETMDIPTFINWLNDTNRDYDIYYHRSKLMSYSIGGFNRSGFKCETWDEFIEYLKEEKDKCEQRGDDVFEIDITNKAFISADAIEKVAFVDYCKDNSISGTGNPDAILYG